MKFTKLLKENKEEISGLWLEKTLQTYPKDSFAFLHGQKDQFANPVGHTHSTAINKIVDLLVVESDINSYQNALTDIIKIRAIQDFSSAGAVSFVLLLKDVVREVLKKELRELPSSTKDLTRFDAWVDQMLLHSFEIYSDLRDQLFRIRIEEVKRNVATLIKRTGFFEEE